MAAPLQPKQNKDGDAATESPAAKAAEAASPRKVDLTA